MATAVTNEMAQKVLIGPRQGLRTTRFLDIADPARRSIDGRQNSMRHLRNRFRIQVKRKNLAKWIGDAVHPVLGYAVGLSVLAALEETAMSDLKDAA